MKRLEICKRGHDLKQSRYYNNGVSKGCKECAIVIGKERYQKKAKEIQAYARRWAKLNPESAQRSRWRDHLKRTYKITPETWNEMFAAQNGRCAICQTKQPEIKPGRIGSANGRLHVDHNHLTGEVRALLCTTCNTAVGALRESPEIAEKLLIYVRKWSQLRLVS